MANKQVEKKANESSEFPIKQNPNPDPRTIDKYVETALKEYLKGYKFDQPTPMLSEGPNVYEIIVTNNVEEINPTRIKPNQTGTGLVFYREFNSNCVMYFGTKCTGVKFLYQWEALGCTWVTSPFFTKGMGEGTNVKCASPIDISDAVRAEFPVPDIVAKLKQISSGGVDANNKLDGTDFEWVIDGASLQDFTIGAMECVSIPDSANGASNSSAGKLYWGMLDGTQGGVKLTVESGAKLILKVKAIKP